MNIEEAKKKLLEPKKIPLVEIIRKFKREGIENFIITRPEIVETLLTAYEKEKNKESKWKPIKDYNRKKYDWVLVKYFDGDYECVPEVAERRNDGKWYTSERQIPFEVKYFFDMQEILEEEYNNVK